MVEAFGNDHSLFDELRRVHGVIRRDLDAYQRVATAVAAGEPVGDGPAQFEEPHTPGLLLQLRTGCLRYCRFVHTHHQQEDAWMLPLVRRMAPNLDPVIDRLEADHSRVSDLLDHVEAAANRLIADDGPPTRPRLVHALAALSAHLLEHLTYEELTLEPVLSTWGLP